MDTFFHNKRVLITGAGRGIGRSIALAFAKCNAEKVYALSKTKSNLDQLVAEEPRITPVCVDLCDWNETKKVITSIGPVDILVNNAAVLIPESFLDITSENFDTQININLKSLIAVSQVVIKNLIERKQDGSIVNVSGVASEVGIECFGVYSSTKGAVDAITKTMAAEFGKHQIRVNSVNPSLVEAGMGLAYCTNETYREKCISSTPLGRITKPEDVANAVLFLSSDQASMIHGQSLVVDGGYLAV